MWTTDTLARALTQELGAPVQVRFTRSRSTPVQAKALGYGPFKSAGVDLGLHGFFEEAPVETVQDLGHWLRVGRRARLASQRLDQWIQARVALLPAKAPRRVRVKTQGQHYDLIPLLHSVGAQEFPRHFGFENPPLDDPAKDLLPLPAITWSQQNPRGKLKSLRLGSYSKDRNLVRIHPLLDDPRAPEFFVRYIIFHELLHAIHPSHRSPGGRWVHHSPTFRRRESRYPDYARALQWEQKDLWSLAKKIRRKRG
ncbi:MAG: hypothetical protein P1V35_12715 [Planctomycetota bacterium]|nr:hypothetical protein [Planctomycetota bacterium]